MSESSLGFPTRIAVMVFYPWDDIDSSCQKLRRLTGTKKGSFFLPSCCHIANLVASCGIKLFGVYDVS